LMAEGRKRAAILGAEADKESKYRAAEARERTAEAEAKATKVVSKALKEGSAQALNYFVAKEYIKALKEIGSSSNSKIVLMPLEASSVIGALGGITELAKEAFQKKTAVSKKN